MCGAGAPRSDTSFPSWINTSLAMSRSLIITANLKPNFISVKTKKNGALCNNNKKDLYPAFLLRPEVSKKFKGLKLLVTVTVYLRIEVEVSKMKSILKLILSLIS